MLRALSFALTAFDAHGCLTLAVCRIQIILFYITFFIHDLSVPHGKDIRNRNGHRATFRTVMTGRTLDRFITVEDLLGFGNDLAFLIIQRFKVFHIRKVVFHLGKI